MRLLIASLLIVCVAACVTPVSTPQAPTVNSPAGQRCVADCQTQYAQCEQPCGVGSSAARVPACQEECYQQLASCYKPCEGR